MNQIRVKMERIRKGIPQYQVAQKLGITQTDLCAIENNRKEATQQQLMQIWQLIKDWKRETN